MQALYQPLKDVVLGPGDRSLTSVDCSRHAPDQTPVISIWDLATGQRRACSQETSVFACAFSLDGRLLAMVNEDLRKIQVQELPSGRPVGPSIVLPAPTSTIAVSPDARLLAAVLGGNVASVWSVATRRELCRFNLQAEIVRCLSFSPDGKTLAAAGTDGSVRVWYLDDPSAAMAG
jgi:WD40 repeat protein